MEQYFALSLKGREEVNLEAGMGLRQRQRGGGRMGGGGGCIKQRQVGRVKVIRRRILSDGDGTENKAETDRP